MTTPTSGQTNILVLEGEATVHGIEPMHSAALGFVPTPYSEIHVDLSGLEAIDSAGGQLLLSISKTFGPKNVKFVGCPAALLDWLRLTGFASRIAVEEHR